MRILFADDHTLVREGIRPFLDELDGDVEVLEAENLPGAEAKAKEAGKLDLILLDLKMPGMNGFSGITNFAKSYPDVPIVILSGHYNRKDVIAALDFGVSGYIPKNIGGMAMVNALRLVLAGEKYLPSDAFSSTPTLEDDSILNQPSKTANQEVDPKFATLTQREAEILTHLVDGKTNKQIARELDLQEITVKIHVRNVYRKIGAGNRAQAVKITLQSGWEPT
ncbi:response regulator transcription factor [Magnetovibrio sp. PR-2]|uniref:response regulator transcription factor n=1 Tax=Magnetovibrio sp. PR-2 TaxID=3120356 RepID=UPI002FCE15A8